ncbi:MAG: hypothetical protein ACREUX_05990, partial [Burkholderiales bacterium]
MNTRAADWSSELDSSYLDWPFFDDSHRRLARDLAHWADENLDASASAEGNAERTVSDLARRLG